MRGLNFKHRVHLVMLTAAMLLRRLTAIRDHSSGMKLLQKKAFVKRLLQSSAVGDVPTWPPYFLRSILPLLPYLPVSYFQQLTAQQVRSHKNDDNGSKSMCEILFAVYQDHRVVYLCTFQKFSVIDSWTAFNCFNTVSPESAQSSSGVAW